MKKGILLFGVLLGLVATGCEDPTLGEALKDVASAAPKVCREYCNPRVDCDWQNLGTMTGEASGVLLADLKSECVINCAYRAENGVFVYEYQWDETSQSNIYNVKARLDGEVWADYLACLVEAALWVCADVNEDPDAENWVYRIDDGNQANCTAFAVCVELLEINLEFEWNPQAQEGAGACQPSGDEFVWGDW